MKNIKFLAIAALALVTGLASCSKESNGTPDSGANFNVNVGFRNATRAVGNAAIAGDKVSIENGYLIFTSAANIITDVFTIKAGAVGEREIESATLLTSGAVCNDVPGTSTKVHLIANVSDIITPPVKGGDITAFMSSEESVEYQGDYQKVLSIKDGVLESVSEGVKSASLALETKVARIQIEDIEFTAGFTAGHVDAIFINGYAPSMKLNGTTSTLVSSTVAAEYMNGSATFPTVFKTFVFDEINQGINFVIRPTPGEVWGYNLFATATPQIIIKLLNVVSNGQNLGTQFVTINGFKNGTINIDELEGGMIYTIRAGTLVIDAGDTSEVPGVKPIKVNVDVSTVKWNETVVTPNL